MNARRSFLHLFTERATGPIGIDVKRFREGLGVLTGYQWSQARLADQIGSTPRTIYKLEKRRNIPRHYAYALYALAFILMRLRIQQERKREMGEQKEALDIEERIAEIAGADDELAKVALTIWREVMYGTADLCVQRARLRLSAVSKTKEAVFTGKIK